MVVCTRIDIHIPITSALQVHCYPSVGAGLAELRGGPPAFGGGASGVPFREGTKSCSLLFCSPSAKYSSNARLGDSPPWRCLRPLFDDRAVDWLPGLVDGEANGGGETMFAGTRKFPEEGGAGEGAEAFGIGSRCCSEPSSLVSNTTSPGPSTSSPNPTGSRCNAPYPSTAPSAPSPPHPLVGTNSTSRTTSNSLL